MSGDGRRVVSHIIKIGKASDESVDVSHARLVVVFAMFAIIFMVLAVRVVDVSIFGGDVRAYAGYKSDDIKFENGRRADIVDRNGVLLAVNLSTASLYANPKVVLDVESAVTKLHRVFPEIHSDVIRKRLSDTDRSFVWIKRNMTPKEQYLVNALGIPGLYFKDEERRVYPHKELCAHVLGFVNIDGRGLSGIEKQFDKYLTGTNDGGYQNDALQLSIDVRVQNVVRNALLESIEKYNAAGASGVVMDVTTGEVISMVSLPDFDLNDPGVASDESKFNRVTYGVYEMGSTFKTFNMALGLELGDIDVTDRYDVSQPIRISGFTIQDYHPQDKKMSVHEIFMHSSNIGSAKIAMDIGAEEQYNFLKRLGLTEELEIEVPERSRPLYPEKWGRTSAMTISYGHGIAVTPMHIVKATAAVVNGGVLYPATLLKRSKYSYINNGEEVVSSATSDKIRKMLRLAVKYGTGARANVKGYLVGGKTGSADKANAGKYDGKSTISSFVAAFPMNKPKYVLLVMVDEPIGDADNGWYTTGGMVAAPVVKKIIARMSPILGVMPVDENDYEIRREFWYDDGTTQQRVASRGTI